MNKKIFHFFIIINEIMENFLIIKKIFMEFMITF